MERALVPRRKFIHNALHHASKTHRRWKGHQRRTADFFTSDELDEEYENLTKPRKVHYKSMWKIPQDAQNKRITILADPILRHHLS